MGKTKATIAHDAKRETHLLGLVSASPGYPRRNGFFWQIMNYMPTGSETTPKHRLCGRAEKGEIGLKHHHHRLILSAIEYEMKEGRIQHVNHIQNAAYCASDFGAEETEGRHAAHACVTQPRHLPHLLVYPREVQLQRKRLSRQIAWGPNWTEMGIISADQDPSVSSTCQFNLVS